MLEINMSQRQNNKHTVSFVVRLDEQKKVVKYVMNIEIYMEFQPPQVYHNYV